MDISTLKARVSIDQLLQTLGVDTREIERRPYNAWAPVRCPLHADKHPSATVNRAAGKFFCHSGCTPRAYDVLDLAGHFIGTTDVREQRDWLTKTFKL